MTKEKEVWFLDGMMMKKEPVVKNLVILDGNFLESPSLDDDVTDNDDDGICR